MKLRHVTVFTSKFEESIKFYSEIVGLTILQDMRKVINRDLLFMGNAEGETMVELVGCEEDQAYNGEGLNLGFIVDDAVSFREELQGKGFEVSPLISPNPFTKFFVTKDPNGLSVQFLSEDAH